jgi:hypothetical protein
MAEQNVADANEDNAEAAPMTPLLEGIMQLVNPPELAGINVEKILGGMYENSFDVTFNMVIRIDDPNAKNSDFQGYSLPDRSLSARAGLPTPGFHVHVLVVAVGSCCGSK